jgi:hypothetical protein
MKNGKISLGLYTALKPLYCVCKVLGLVTYSYVKNKKNTTVTTFYGRASVVYSMVWILFCVIAFTYTIWCFHNCDPQEVPEKVRIVSYVYYTILYISCLACFVNAILSRRKCPLIFKKLSLVDGLLFKQQEEELVNRNSMLTSVAEIVTVFVATLVLSWIFIYTSTTACYTTFLATLECVVPCLITMVAVHYCKLVRVTHERHKHMNRHLSTCISHACTNNYLKYENRCQGKSRFTRQVNILTSRVSSIDFRSFNGLDLRYLRIILSELNYVVSLINENYGISVFAVTCSLITRIISVIFFILLDPYLAEYVGAGWLIFFFALLIRISSTCHAAASENDTSKFLVQMLLLEDDLTPKDTRELKFLSFQLNNTPVQYSACGFFVLNLPFLCSVTGVIISYIMIIVQLK